MNNYFKNPKMYIKHFSILLICLGVFDIIMLVLAFKFKFSYSGGAILYIIGGVFLLKGDKNIYVVTRTYILVMAALINGGFLSSLYLQIQALLSTSTLAIKYYALISLVPLLLLTLFFNFLTALLWKKETLEFFEEAPKNEIKILKDFIICIPKKRLILSVAGAFFILFLFLGPNLFINTFNKIDKKIVNYSRTIKKYRIKKISVNNWTTRIKVETYDAKNQILIITHNPLSKKVTVREYDSANHFIF